MTTLRTLLSSFDFFMAGRRAPGFALGFFLAMTAVLAAAPMNFDIAAQPATSALPLFITQSGAQVMYGHEEVAKVPTHAVTGVYEPKAALALLLKNTGLRFTERGDGLFVVKHVGAEENARGTVRGTVVRPELGSSGNIRILVRETGQQVVTDRRGDFVLANVDAGIYTLIASAEGLQTMHITDVIVRAGRELVLSRETMRKASDVTELEPFIVRGRADEVTELDKYIVEGRREKPFTAGNMDIPRTINDAQPYYIFDAKTIDQSGAANVEDFLKQRLTMNTLADTNSQGSSNFRGNTSSVNLRGLGTDKTLILVNGRRVAGVNVEGTDFQADLNGVPLSAIERIEVLPTSASGIYGGGAIGGVVNVILKNNYAGGELQLGYDNTWDTDSPRRTASLLYGFALEGGRTQVMLNASYSDTAALLKGDRRELYARGLARIMKNDPTAIYSATSPFMGAVPNIAAVSSTRVTNLQFKDGSYLGAAITYVPAGTRPDLTAAELKAALLKNAGTYNLEPADTTQSYGLRTIYGSVPTTRAFSASIRREMTKTLELTLGLGRNENESTRIYNPISGFTVAADHPYNPFTTAVSVRVPNRQDSTWTTQSTTQSVNLGALLKLPHDWMGQVDYAWSRNDYDYLYNVGGTMTTQALAGLNPFMDTNLYPLNFSAFLSPYIWDGQSTLRDFSLRGSGPLPSLPWGRPRLTFGLEHRVSSTPDSVRHLHAGTGSNSETKLTYFGRKAQTDSVYAELSVPLLKEKYLPGVHSLELQVSGRTEQFRVDTGTTYRQDRIDGSVLWDGPTLNGGRYLSKATYGSDNATVGLKYQPVEDVIIRASLSNAFVPPTPFQLTDNPFVNPNQTQYLDPKLNERYLMSTISGGNPNLRPQNSESVNVGAIWTPSWEKLKGLRFNAEYYKIEQFDKIATLGAQDILNDENIYPDRVTRGADGRVTLVNVSSVNLFKLETEGVDLSASYHWKTSRGTFDLQGLGTVILHEKRKDALTTPVLDYVGHVANGGPGKIKANATLNWEHRGWSLSWSSQYYDSYAQYGIAGGPYSTRYQGGLIYDYYIKQQGAETIPSQTYHTFVAGYNFGHQKVASGSRLASMASWLLNDLKVQVGVRNVFNTLPHIDIYYTNSYTSPYGDPRLRTYWINLKKAF
ncbi:TonB-dependent receptor domain-containing protein [Oleiharenicola lentus]|uniref:TonB-dependent receptor domain-containing protein n=1 Tax=Oleiharenicola lentus TaxID=2508720 RepID=UPI003F66A5F9